jgi:hypothetical protein
MLAKTLDNGIKEAVVCRHGAERNDEPISRQLMPVDGTGVLRA